ncbi:MAG: Asp-tRNA(Asn)/Glu-tRNA(Gln) amidotransferase subunit GatA [Chlamydiales bacterium]|nr:Asp-tRNA(Asn)/Glu-tRNA(Gln) amidotransferase subunit GatA [Chlamydiales bacterium]
MYKNSATALHQAFLEGKLTASEIAAGYLARIQAFDEEVKSFLNVFADRVMEKAEKLDGKRATGAPLGKLAGIPIAIKDNIQVRGETTTCASKFLSNYTAPYDATAVRLIEEQDGLIIGKTNLDEFAMGSSTEHSAFQMTKNPWNLSHAPGGSSGGSAACVSARLSPISLGSDTGGSIRQPAAFTGTVGFKPTYGRISRYGLVAFGSSLDQIGPFANSVKDVALMMEVMGKPCNHDATNIKLPGEPFLDHLGASIQGRKVGVPWAFLEGLSSAAKELFETNINVLKSAGAEIVEIDLSLLKHSIPVYYILSTAEASTNLARFDGIRYGKRSEKARSLNEIYDMSREEGFGAEVKQRILLGTFVLSSGYQDAYYKKAQKVRSLIIEAYKKAFEVCDVVAMPTTPSPAFEIGGIQDPLEMYLQDLYTVSANLAGLPAISIPTGKDKNDLPHALQLLGPQMDDGKVLHFAYQFEKALKLSGFIPPLFDQEVSL